jgi:hypothetical protein
MNKKALIAIGVIAILGIGTYAVIVNNNKNKNTNTGGGNKPPTTPTAPPTDKNGSLFCKYLNIGCGLSGKVEM